MAAVGLLECSFLIPDRRDPVSSDGKPHRRKSWVWLEEKLWLFGGMTRSLGFHQGGYVDPDMGERVPDRSRKYSVAIPRARLGELRELLGKACGQFHQKCIYLNVAGHVEFVERSKHEKRD